MISPTLVPRCQTQKMGRWRSGLDLQKPARPSPHRSTWKARNIRLKTKLRIFKSNVISTLLYGSESWKVTKTISNKLDVFQNRCLRRILQIYWPNTITNEELHRRAEIEPISTQVKRRRWRWIGHVLRQQTTALTRIALRWTPDGQRKRGRPKETWRRTVAREMKEKAGHGAVWSVSQLIDTVGGLWFRPYVLPEAQRRLDVYIPERIPTHIQVHTHKHTYPQTHSHNANHKA